MSETAFQEPAFDASRDPLGMRLLRSLLLWLVLTSAVALFWPVWFGAGNDPFLASRPWLSPLIVVTMFALGSLLPADELRQLGKRWPAVLAGTALQSTVMPLAALAVASVIDADPSLRIGLLMVGCVPGAMASNVLTYAAGGNVSYSVSLTTAATLLSPVTVPALLGLTLGASSWSGVDFQAGSVAMNLATTVVAPVVAGHLCARRWAGFARGARRAAPLVANVAILWIIATVVGLNRASLLTATASVIAALLVINVIGYSAGYAGGAALRLPESMRRALTLEVGMQNAGLGSVLAVQMFPEHASAAIPTAAYTFGCMLTGALLGSWWSRSPAADRGPASHTV